MMRMMCEHRALCARLCSMILPRSTSSLTGRLLWGTCLYSTSRIFSLTWEIVSQSSTRTRIGLENSCRSVTRISYKCIAKVTAKVLTCRHIYLWGNLNWWVCGSLYHLSVVQLLTNQFILTQREPGFTGYQVDGPLGYLFLHGLIQEE